MDCKLYTKDGCAEKAVLECTPVELLIIQKALAWGSRDEEYAESDRALMRRMFVKMGAFEEVKR